MECFNSEMPLNYGSRAHAIQNSSFVAKEKEHTRMLLSGKAAPLGCWQVNWQNKATSDTRMKPASLALEPALEQTSLPHWPPLSPLFSLHLTLIRADDGIISPGFLQEGSACRELSTSRGTLQLWLRLFRLRTLLVINHSADRYSSRRMGQMLQDSLRQGPTRANRRTFDCLSPSLSPLGRGVNGATRKPQNSQGWKKIQLPC